MPLDFGAPWSRSLQRSSALVVVLLAAVAAAGVLVVPAHSLLVRCLMIALPLAVLAGALCSRVSGYTLTAAALEVQRPLWRTTFALADLSSVVGDAAAFTGAFRLFGNGGLFSFTGIFWSRRLGCFRALATDPARAVVLRFRRRTLVITPGDSQHFIVRVRTHLQTAERAAP
ncbi:MAG TPA: PH domain-containing protein [Steroidobacteraceae bacterium]|jgi:hypothetical protein|nr:PH domain-containing protein [Steroidobacteraceae bacterium]